MAASSRPRLLLAFGLVLALAAIAWQGLRIYNTEHQHALTDAAGLPSP